MALPVTKFKHWPTSGIASRYFNTSSALQRFQLEIANNVIDLHSLVSLTVVDTFYAESRFSSGI